MELWNNEKYLNITPTFKITKSRNITGSINLYRKIDINSCHRDKTLTQAKLDKLEWILKERNTTRILGELNTTNQISLDLMSDDELISQAKEYAKMLEGEE